MGAKSSSVRIRSMRTDILIGSVGLRLGVRFSLEFSKEIVSRPEQDLKEDRRG